MNGSLPRGLKNRNPGNIRRSGVRFRGEKIPSRDAAFKEFTDMKWGYRAIFVILDTYRRKYGLDTLETVIARWAPPSENDTAAYVRTVAGLSGVAPYEVLKHDSEEVMCRVVAAMSRVENGIPARMDEVRSGWQAFVG